MTILKLTKKFHTFFISFFNPLYLFVEVDQVWLARWPGLVPERKSSELDWEEGLYQYFDVKVWKRIPGWFRLHYDKLGSNYVGRVVLITLTFLS